MIYVESAGAAIAAPDDAVRDARTGGYVHEADVTSTFTGLIGGPLADYECVHGRLPGDRTPPCGCWQDA